MYESHAKPALVSPKALAERWSCSPGHLANQRCRGEGLPFVKIGGAVRYRLADIEAAERGKHPETVRLHHTVSSRP